eukprot:INCI5851.1.p2 GENE.INCI5851.1~~INCI5851.1.p2  ORF type:complete len:139 (-),score=6.27 INCI5851.1:225-641(-)
MHSRGNRDSDETGVPEDRCVDWRVRLERAICAGICEALWQAKFPGRIGIAGPQVSYVDVAGQLEQYYPLADMFVRGYAEEAIGAIARGETKCRGVHMAGAPDLVEQTTVSRTCPFAPIESCATIATIWALGVAARLSV